MANDELMAERSIEAAAAVLLGDSWREHSDYPRVRTAIETALSLQHARLAELRAALTESLEGWDKYQKLAARVLYGEAGDGIASDGSAVRAAAHEILGGGTDAARILELRGLVTL